MPKQTLGLIGVGAFGELAARHLAPHFSLRLHDPYRDLKTISEDCAADIVNLEDAARSDVILLAVPVQKLDSVLRAIAPHIKIGALVVDVSSIKVKPMQTMETLLPPSAQLVGTHPLFGPQSAKEDIVGLSIVICPLRGSADKAVRRFCRKKLGLNVFMATAEEHDRNMAYVQGLTHFVSRILLGVDEPTLRFTTKTYDLMKQMIEMVRYDSDDLFRAIAQENPFSAKVKEDFFASARRLETGHGEG